MGDQEAAQARAGSRYARFLAQLEQHLWLLGALQLPLVFALLLVLLPLSASTRAPLHDLLGGVFAGNTPWQVFFSAVTLVTSR